MARKAQTASSVNVNPSNNVKAEGRTLIRDFDAFGKALAKWRSSDEKLRSDMHTLVCSAVFLAHHGRYQRLNDVYVSLPTALKAAYVAFLDAKFRLGKHLTKKGEGLVIRKESSPKQLGETIDPATIEKVLQGEETLYNFTAQRAAVAENAFLDLSDIAKRVEGFSAFLDRRVKQLRDEGYTIAPTIVDSVKAMRTTVQELKDHGALKPIKIEVPASEEKVSDKISAAA